MYIITDVDQKCFVTYLNPTNYDGYMDVNIIPSDAPNAFLSVFKSNNIAEFGEQLHRLNVSATVNRLRLHSSTPALNPKKFQIVKLLQEITTVPLKAEEVTAEMDKARLAKQAARQEKLNILMSKLSPEKMNDQDIINLEHLIVNMRGSAL